MTTPSPSSCRWTRSGANGPTVSFTITAIERLGSAVAAVAAVTAVTDDGAGGGAALDDDRDAEGRYLLPLETVIMHRIHSGATFEAEQWERIRAEGAQLLATRRGLELLARHERTAQELRDALARDEFDAADIEPAIARLHDTGYLNDAAWATHYVASTRARSRGGALLRRELRARGVADVVAGSALAERDELAAALEAAGRRLRSLRSLDAEQQRRRLYDFLRRRGFADDITRRAVTSTLAEPDTFARAP